MINSKCLRDYILTDVYQRSKLVLAEIVALVQTDDIGRLNYVQLPKSKLALTKFKNVILKNYWAIFNQAFHKASLGDDDRTYNKY